MYLNREYAVWRSLVYVVYVEMRIWTFCKGLMHREAVVSTLESYSKFSCGYRRPVCWKRLLVVIISLQYCITSLDKCKWKLDCKLNLILQFLDTIKVMNIWDLFILLENLMRKNDLALNLSYHTKYYIKCWFSVTHINVWHDLIIDLISGQYCIMN